MKTYPSIHLEEWDLIDVRQKRQDKVFILDINDAEATLFISDKKMEELIDKMEKVYYDEKSRKETDKALEDAEYKIDKLTDTIAELEDRIERLTERR
jgi:oligoribonuclease NrnB/cAMP/cGMP phosphodiesterase (DHH superfamily)